MGFIIIVVLVVLFLVGSVSGSGSGNNGSKQEDLSRMSETELKKILKERLYLKDFLEANKPLIQMVIRDLVEKDFWLGLPNHLQKELKWFWLYRDDQSHTIYMVLNTNLGGAKALLEYKENSRNPSFMILHRQNEEYMYEDELATENAASQEVAKNLRYYDGSAKSRKAVEAFNDADGFMRKHRNLLTPNLESWMVYSAYLPLKQ